MEESLESDLLQVQLAAALQGYCLAQPEIRGSPLAASVLTQCLCNFPILPRVSGVLLNATSIVGKIALHQHEDLQHRIRTSLSQHIWARRACCQK